jgi:hypothetical protein
VLVGPGGNPRAVTPSASGMAETIADLKVTAEGVDCAGTTHDAHVRIENGALVVDVFRSAVKDANRAHVESQSFPLTPSGSCDADDFLQDYGILVRLWV